MMKRYTVVTACFACVLLGCRVTPDPTEPVGPPTATVDLKLLQAPPVSAKCELMPLPGYAKTRRYLVYDLNDDGTPEYFIENYAGAHSVGFALVDSAGRLMTRTTDIGEIGGDRLLVLATRHSGHHDLLSSEWDPWSIKGVTWEFNGKRYVKARAFAHEGTKRADAFIEKVPGLVKASWHADAFSRPPPESSNNKVAGQTATRPVVAPEGSDKLQPEPEGRAR